VSSAVSFAVAVAVTPLPRSLESLRSHRGMSTTAQIATMATYRIALLNDPPLGVASAGWPGWPEPPDDE
jgi:hypothetical protein